MGRLLDYRGRSGEHQTKTDLSLLAEEVEALRRRLGCPPVCNAGWPAHSVCVKRQLREEAVPAA